jgi:hypothetical protein
VSTDAAGCAETTGLDTGRCWTMTISTAAATRTDRIQKGGRGRRDRPRRGRVSATAEYSQPW